MSALLEDRNSAGSLRTSVGEYVFNEMRCAIAGLIPDQVDRWAEADLMVLSDRMLKDIGLDRGDITSALMDHAQERKSGAWRSSW